MSKITVAVAGSTDRTALCAASLFADERFEMRWILTPAPKILGRKKVLTQNPLHHWAVGNSLQAITLEKKIDAGVKDAILEAPQVDFLLVVDFGYLVPKWLLELPNRAPLNIHPSLLPRWRGSSPGQFVLLYGEKDSAVTLMVMDEGLDSGPLVAQLPFDVSDTWTQQEYYQHSFALISKELPDLMSEFAVGKLDATPQPSDSPTPVARRLAREDGYVAWESLEKLLAGETDGVELNPLLSEAKSAQPEVAALIVQACKAFSPWPGLWTTINDQRLKILSCHVENHRLVLGQVQLEGKQPTSWLKFQSQ